MASKYSTSESEHIETPPAKRKFFVYNQNYLKKWESDPKSMPAFSGMSRQEKQVEESEIRLAAYISEHNAPFTSMEHLVPLIQAVCPNSEIAKLKIQSIKAVSWCEFFFLSLILLQ